MSESAPFTSASAVAVVLAGGFGTRLAGVLAGIPKPMAPAQGRPFLEWVVRFLAASGIGQVVLSTGHLAHVIEEYFAAVEIPGVAVTCLRETTPLGTGGAFLNAARASGLRPPAWIACNGDSLILEPLDGLFNALEAKADGALVGWRTDEAQRFGTLSVGPDGMLRSFAEKQAGAGLINAGVYLFRSALLDHFPEKTGSPPDLLRGGSGVPPDRAEQTGGTPVPPPPADQKTPLSFEFDVFPHLLARGCRLQVQESSAPFLDIGTEQTLSRADAFIARHRYCFR